ncbi:MAG TPA: ATP-binding cassette domain-containing protein, partial [Deltaproteobacteria bacterium]|nr:ATP-binding cassette domain-containing protein [Deltaproteobacteria bacterium]
RLAGLCREMGFDLDPETPVVRLTVGERQQLELARHLAAGRRVLILDEPTTGISSLQKDVLFSALRRLSSGGATVVLVSHKLEDVETLCDEVTVLKKGRVSGSAVRPFSTGALLEMMFGREPAPPLRKGHEPGAQALFLEGVHAHGGRTGLAQCTVKVNRGEVVGLAGLEGSGQDVFLRVAAGLTRPTRGRVHVSRKDMTGRDHHAFKTMGVAFQPAARLEEGLIAGLSVAEHCAILERSSFSLDLDASASLAQERIQSFQVAARPESPVESLSGGNQQRLLLSFLPDDPVLLLLENPTRGLDRESVRWVWERLDAIASNGAAIVFSSSEIDEILMVSDRVLVFFEGRIIHDVRPEDTDALMLGKAIAGRV